MKNHSFRSTLFSCALFFVSFMYGQNNLNHQSDLSQAVSIPNSPEAEAFAKYGNSSVNLFTGTPNIQVPVYNHKGRELDLPIVLDYDASGVKIDQVASNAGLGWNLNVGGRISRIVNGRPDDYIDISGGHYFSLWSNSAQSKIQQYKDDPDNLYFPSKQAVEDYLLFKKDINDGKYDTQPDFFTVNAPGLSDMIVFDVDSRLPITLDNNRTKVSVVRGSNATSGAQGFTQTWIVTSDNGTKYYFGEINNGNLEDVERTWTQNFDDINEAPPIGYNKKYISSWVLTKIVSATGRDVYEFGYNNTLPYWDEVQNNYLAEIDVIDFSGAGGGTSAQINSTTGTSYRIKTVQITEVKHNGKIIAQFNYSSRYDLTGGNFKLSKITTFSDYPTKHKTFELNQSYFKTDPNINPATSTIYDIRLKLDEVVIQDKTLADVETYSFDYILPDNIGVLNGLSQDYSGYNNGRNMVPNQNDQTFTFGVLIPKYIYGDVSNGEFFPGANRDPEVGSAKRGLLNRINYPTGGFSVYEYEADQVLTYEADTQVQFVTLVDESHEVTSTPPYNANYCNAIAPGSVETSPDIFTKTFIVDYAGNYTIDHNTGGTTPSPSLFGHTVYVVAIADNSSQICQPIGWDEILDNNCNPVSDNIIYSGLGDNSETIWLEEGCYQLTFANPFVGITLDAVISGNISVPVQNAVYTDQAGLRVSEIKDYANDNSIANHRIYEYPSGTLSFKANNLVSLTTREVVNGNTGTIESAQYLQRVAHVNGGNKPHITYPKVIEKVVDANNEASNGYNVYLFNTAGASSYKNGLYTHPSLAGTASNNVFHYGTDFGLGQKKEVESYEIVDQGASADLLKRSSETEYDYGQFYSAKSIYVETNPRHAFKFAIPQLASNGDWTYVLIPGSYFPGQAGVYGAITPPTESYASGQNTAVTTDKQIASLVMRNTYVYGRMGKVTESTTREFENNEELSQNVKYFYYDVGLSNNQRNYQFPEPVIIADNDPTETNPNTGNGLLKMTLTEDSKGHEVITKYSYPENFSTGYGSMISTNMVSIPVKTLSHRNSHLTSRSKSIYSGILPERIESGKGADNLEERMHFDHYVDNNLVEYHTDGNTKTTIVWGYNHRYPVAKIENASYSEVTNTVNYSSIQNLDGSALINALSSLRAALPNALVTIYTYIPSVGMNTMTSPDGYTSEYVYDNFDRLLYIKDQNGNVIKQFDYNYRLNDPGQSGGGNPYDPLTVNGIIVENQAGNPISNYNGNIYGVNGGSGDFTYQWSYQYDNTGNFYTFDQTNTNHYVFQYNIDNSNICVQGYSTIKFRCKLIDNQVSNSSVTVTSSSLSINCSGNQQ